jgi:hypothetical protein
MNTSTAANRRTPTSRHHADANQAGADMTQTLDHLAGTTAANAAANAKGLTVRQPWAAAIAHFGKNVENRTWSTRYRGPLLIHAGLAAPNLLDLVEAAEISGKPLSELAAASQTFGAVVAVAELSGICHPAAVRVNGCGCGPWAERGRFHWRLANIRTLRTPQPMRGHLGLWMPHAADAADLAAAVEARPAGGSA